MTVATIIQARTGSSRLPGKVLLPVGAVPVLEWVVHRVRRSRTAGEIVVATSASSSDDSIAALCRRIKVRCIRGSETDVLSRYVDAARSVAADVIVRVTADSPVLAPELLDAAVSVQERGGTDYAWVEGAPVGFACEAVGVQALETAARLASDPADREHVTRFLLERPQQFDVVIASASPELTRPTFRLTLDYPHDLAFLRRLYERSDGSLFDLSGVEIISMIDRDADLLEEAERSV